MFICSRQTKAMIRLIQAGPRRRAAFVEGLAEGGQFAFEFAQPLAHVFLELLMLLQPGVAAILNLLADSLALLIRRAFEAPLQFALFLQVSVPGLFKRPDSLFDFLRQHRAIRIRRPRVDYVRGEVRFDFRI